MARCRSWYDNFNNPTRHRRESHERGLSRSAMVKAQESPTSCPSRSSSRLCRCKGCRRRSPWLRERRSTGCPNSCLKRSPWLRERRSTGCPNSCPERSPWRERRRKDCSYSCLERSPWLHERRSKDCPNSCSRRSSKPHVRWRKGCPRNQVHKDILADPQADYLALRLNRWDLDHRHCQPESLYWLLSDLLPAEKY